MITRHFIRNKITTIPNNLIWYTSSDGNIVTPSSTYAFGASIASNTYEDGKGIIKFDSNVTSIGDWAFSGCSSLTSITIPSSVTSIGYATFDECSSLISVTISNSVMTIGDYAFKDCSPLTSITIPNSVKSIGEYAFMDCYSLTTITCEATTPPTLGSSNNLSNVIAVYVPAEYVDAYKTAANWDYYANKIKPIQD